MIILITGASHTEKTALAQKILEKYTIELSRVEIELLKRCMLICSIRTLDEDCFSKSTTAYTVTHIFSAPNDAKKYTTLLFLDENAMIDSLPDEIKNMLDQTLLHK